MSEKKEEVITKESKKKISYMVLGVAVITFSITQGANQVGIISFILGIGLLWLGLTGKWIT